MLQRQNVSRSSRPARWQRGGQRNQRRKRASLVPKSARIVSGRRHHRLLMLVDHLMCNTRSTTEVSNRSWHVSQVCSKAHASSGRGRRNRRCLGCVFQRLLSPGSSMSPWFAASCCRDVSLAVIQPHWVQQTAEVPSMFEEVATTHTCAPFWEEIATQLTLLNHSHMAEFILILLVMCMRPSELLALRRKILSRRLCHFSHVGRS